MARGLILVVLTATAAVLATGCGSDDSATAPTAPSEGIPAPPEEMVAFGQIVSVRREDDRWVMRFDPALSLSGETANVAAAEDGVVEPGEPVPNDSYVVDESDRLYTYVVADDAEVVVLARSGSQYGGTTVDVSELEKILAGTSDVDLFEPLDTGVWITYRIDTVSRIVHQYRP
jgi:hypothetical protein